MTNDKLNSDINLLYDQLEIDKCRLISDYVKFNNPYKIGDIIKDHCRIIKIERMIISISNRCMVYEGVLLKKDLTPMKKQDDNRIFQTNIIT